MGQACCAERDHFQNIPYTAQPIYNISSPRYIKSIDPGITAKLNQLQPYKFINIMGVERGTPQEIQKLENINCYYRG